MRWSKSILKHNQAERTILEFVPQKFNLGTPDQAIEYLSEKKLGSDFVMNEVLRVQTGVDQIEESNLENLIEEKSLEKLKEIQENAYTEAYKLGLDEGTKVAFDKAAAEITQQLAELENTLTQIRHIKTEMEAQNESHLIRLVFKIASRISMQVLEENPESLIKVIRQAASDAQEEENIRVQVSEKQFEFIEAVKKHTGREYEFMKKMRFEPSPDVIPGGCVVQTNYGEIDSRVEERLQQMWNGLYQHMPKVKDVVGG